MTKTILLIALLQGFVIVCALRFDGNTVKGRRAFSSRSLISMSGVTVSVSFRNERKTESYPIHISRNLIENINHTVPLLKECSKVLIVSNSKVAPLYLPSLRKACRTGGKEVYDVVLEDGEEFKDIHSCLKIFEKSLSCGLDRKSLMIALGGGVVGDITGFAASVYQRGVPFVQIPTTLMAMVDSSVGGKTAVNHPLGKNMIGSFHQPKAVLSDLTTLETLPDREFLSGIAEVIKYGLVDDFQLFQWLEGNVGSVLARDSAAIEFIIRRSCEIKASIVAKDEKEENGLRAVLNLGHTFGHVIEAGFGYGTWLHGEAVAAGMMMAADMSFRLSLISPQLLSRLERLLVRLALPVNLHNKHATEKIGKRNYEEKRKQLTTSSFLEVMNRDKKNAHGNLHLILLKEEENSVGCSAFMTTDFPFAVLQQTISSFCIQQ